MSKKKPDSNKKVINRRPFWIGFDLGGTKMMACVLDAEFKVLGEARKSSQGDSGAAKGMKRVAAVINEAMEEAGVLPENLKGIGIACPGTVNPLNGMLIHAPNLGWRRVPVATILGRLFDCPVAVLNDVDAGTYGEYEMGAARGARSVLGVFPGTGLGAGFVYDGRLVQGREVSCMELGMILLPGTHLASTVPGTVLMEDLTSRLGIAAAASVECYRGNAPQLNAKTGAVLKEMKSKALSNSLQAAEAGTTQVFANAMQYLGMGVAMVVNLLGPDHIVLGGGLVEELPKYYLQMLREEVRRFALPEITRGIKFSIAKLGGQAVAIGAVAYLKKTSETPRAHA
jgi:glucokinase